MNPDYRELLEKAMGEGEAYLIVIDSVGRTLVLDIHASMDGHGWNFIPKADWPDLRSIKYTKDNRFDTVTVRPRRHRRVEAAADR